MAISMENGKHSILIIDDQRMNITALSKALRPEYNVFAVGNGRDALIAAESSRPDVILLDIKMDDMDGYEVITALKRNEVTKNIPVIFITGLADVESEEKGLALGAVDYIRKPFSAAIVKLRLDNQIKIIDMEKNLRSSAEKLESALEVAQEATKAKSSFLSNMSHEIRTPMNAITGMGELLQHEHLEARQMGYVNDIVASAKSLIGIINDILDFSKIESGKLELNPIDYDFKDFLHNIESMFLVITQEKGLEFKLNKGEGLPEILLGDDLRLRQTLTNLVGNAIKFTEKGHVSLSITASDGTLTFEIADTGIGIRPEDQPKLFSAFEQVDKSKNRNIVGTGLGLAISKSFVELMGGSIELKSEYGEGTTFTIKIPIVEGNKEQFVKRKSANESHALHAPEAKVLVVDDNEFNRKVASGLLSLMDIEADSADSGFKALELVKKYNYDIVFMDHMMPEMDGMETTALIRKMGRKYENLPIIALTANAVQGAREMFLANGFNEFLSKPIDTGELVRILEDWLPLEKVVINVDYEENQNLLNKEDELRRKSIITFVKENRSTFEKITSSLSTSDIKTAHRIAHTLKSSAGYLGKRELQQAALSLETSLQNETPTYTADQLDILLRELDRTLREFEPLYKEAESLKPEARQMDSEELKALLSELKPLLEKCDFSAEKYASKLHGTKGMKELADKLEDYDFEGALKILTTI
jgi:signal transduction histidine kinase/HPt (histidine-containing phosphotransfer) domain-containing protein